MSANAIGSLDQHWFTVYMFEDVHDFSCNSLLKDMLNKQIIFKGRA